MQFESEGCAILLKFGYRQCDNKRKCQRHSTLQPSFRVLYSTLPTLVKMGGLPLCGWTSCDSPTKSAKPIVLRIPIHSSFCTHHWPIKLTSHFMPTHIYWILPHHRRLWFCMLAMERKSGSEKLRQAVCEGNYFYAQKLITDKGVDIKSVDQTNGWYKNSCLELHILSRLIIVDTHLGLHSFTQLPMKITTWRNGCWIMDTSKMVIPR
jgi:hypothetical protein